MIATSGLARTLFAYQPPLPVTQERGEGANSKLVNVLLISRVP